MIRVVSFVLAAILCHSSAALADAPVACVPPRLETREFQDFEQHVKFAIFVLQTAQHRHAIRRCLSERCMRHAKKIAGWAALYLVGVNVLRKYVSGRYIGSSMAAYATKAAARLGLTIVGLAGADAVLLTAVAYESTIGLLGPADAPGSAESILFNEEHLDRLLAMEHHRIFCIAMHDKIIADELVMMAHASILATFPEFQTVWEKFYIPPPPAPKTPWLMEYQIFPTF